MKKYRKSFCKNNSKFELNNHYSADGTVDLYKVINVGFEYLGNFDNNKDAIAFAASLNNELLTW